MIPSLQLDCPRECDRIGDFIRRQLDGAGFRRLVLGMSGGLDSALVGALAARAIGPENVHAIVMPYRTSNPESLAHARLVNEWLGLSWECFDISPMVDAVVASDASMDDRRKGNVMARCRMVVWFDRAAKLGALVAGTSNRTESLLGYFTVFGDGGCSFKTIAHLYKCQVRELAGHLGVPDAILRKAPSADLWDGQTDEGELGFGYDEADAILYLLTERGLDEASVVAQGYAPEVVQAIQRRMRLNAFKLCQPPALPVEGRADLCRGDNNA
ncbi:MAG TPA: NAD+ synthase [Chloroflexi bacterium]|jgi:NAD+ synthase|nr:NAD+ synthase [Chloroflexota bacterium]